MHVIYYNKTQSRAHRGMNMLKVVCAAAVIAATTALAFTGAAHARAGLSLNGTSLNGQTAVAGPIQVAGLVLPNGVVVSVR